jgi:hypothetical protein
VLPPALWSFELLPPNSSLSTYLNVSHCSVPLENHFLCCRFFFSFLNYSIKHF